jgi:hypothetical protein
MPPPTVITKVYATFRDNLVRVRFRPIYDELLMPLKVLKHGHIPLLLYVFGILYALPWIFNESSRLAISAAREALITAKAPLWAFSYLTFFLKIALGVLLFPFAVIACVLPVREIWIHGKLAIIPTLHETLTSYPLALRSSSLAIRYSLHKLFPALVLIAMYFFFTHKVKQDFVYLALLGTTVLVSLYATKASFPILFAPVLAVCAQMNPVAAVQLSESLLKPRSLQLLSIITAGLGSVIAYTICLFGTPFPMLSRFEVLHAVGLSFLIWYFLTLIVFQCMRSVTKSEVVASEPRGTLQQPMPSAN